MKNCNIEETISSILREDPRYRRDAYYFLQHALAYAAEHLDKPRTGKKRHLSAQELTDCIRIYALDEFGPLALTVLNHWGIQSTEDFGEIVFNMVDKGLLGKTDEDKKEDFDDGFDFETAFKDPFLPKTDPRPARSP